MLNELQSEFLTEFIVVARARIKKALAMLYSSGSSSAGASPADAGGSSIDELMHTIAGEASMIGLPDVAAAARAAQVAAKSWRRADGRASPALVACARAIRSLAVMIDALKPAPAASAEPAKPASEADGPGRVLVVDDSPFNTAVLCNALSAVGVRAVAVGDNLQQALAELAALRPHLVLVDAIMPNLDPGELCRAIRASAGGSQIKLLLFTAMTQQEAQAQAQAQALPIDGFVTKDLGIDAIVARVQALLPGRTS